MIGVIPVVTSILATLLLQAPAVRDTAGFDHPAHAKLFPRCESCHLDRTGAVSLPAPSSCAACHDGTIQPQVAWRPSAAVRMSNLRFDHARHASASAASNCVACHQESDDRWMQTRVTIVGRCLDCHGQTVEHLAAADSSCATCHVPLAEARTLTVERIRQFRAPPGHADAGFMGTGPGSHGRGAAGTPASGASCATCHTRDFCLNCHVNGPETPSIAAMAADSRGRAIEATLRAPASHAAADFGRAHAALAGSNGQACATCHTRASCTACHVGRPVEAVRALAAAGPGRAVGAIVARRLPSSHRTGFDTRHAGQAATAERSCATCHLRRDCLACHRPDPASGGGEVHPRGFLTRHPAEAYSRPASCASCHDTRQFCAACHAETGTTAGRVLGSGARYHDAKRFFLVGHGRAARQSLESCVSCHAERDCLTCHAAQGGRRFNPHGPGFDPERLRRKNPEMCTACHGMAIPGG